MKEKTIQPAKESYFFRQGYVDLINTIKGVYRKNKEEADKRLKASKGKSILNPKAFLQNISAYAIIIIGGLITILTSIVHVSILTVSFVAVYMMFFVVWLLDRTYILINRINNACPESTCQASFLIPAYQCPECGIKHTRLVPGKYGILKRECQCGCKMPTTFLNGRGNLNASCPHCGSSLHGKTNNRQYAIPVIGGPSVGKSCYINMALDKLFEEAPKRGWSLSFASGENEQDYTQAITQLKRGQRLEKTDFDALTAYQLFLQLPNEKIGRRIYFYDISGEMFSSSSNITKNEAYRYSTGFIFLIDPLTIRKLAIETADQIEREKYGASDKDFEDILNAMLVNLEKMLGVKSNGVINKDLAIVINKCDIPFINRKIGDKVTNQYLSEHPECTTFQHAKNQICKNFLEEYDSGNFVRMAEQKFRNVQYFTCSALGHNVEGEPYHGKSVEIPLLWLLSQADEKINL